jgi:hypothetical protein
VLEELNCAPNREGVKYSDPKSGHSSKKVSAFQNNSPHSNSRSIEGKATQGPDKVFILNVGAACTSGRWEFCFLLPLKFLLINCSNLTGANHVIFVSPYYAKGSSSQKLFESRMTKQSAVRGVGAKRESPYISFRHDRDYRCRYY